MNISKFVLISIICAFIFTGCTADELPGGSYVSNLGTIIIEGTHIQLIDIDEDFLRETYAVGQATKVYFAKSSEGIILTEEEMSELKKQYYEAFEPSLYSDKTYTCEYEYNSFEYLWEYYLKDDEGNGIWSLTYYEKDDYIDFNGEVFNRQ